MDAPASPSGTVERDEHLSVVYDRVPAGHILRQMSLVLQEDRGPVRHIVLNRPDKRNALNTQIIEQLGEALRAAAGDIDVRCVVLRGAGTMFSSGMDAGDLQSIARDPESLRDWRERILAIWSLCERMAKPTIAQIHGACLGGAAELALACDLRVVAEESMIGLVETRIGLIPDLGGCSRLAALVGLGRAKELIMCSKFVDGIEAERIGLANRVAPAAELHAATGLLVGELLTCAPLAVGLAKGIIDAAAMPALDATLEQEVTAQELCATSDDFREGVQAFAERRPPRFGGT